ncbi:MAG: 50S ribosomal protein L23 [Candidatus Magasanikbacteria bacterium]|nr:50S ribosomal protein L23 [Candidatus Magasanikbacteria bacterium]
MSLFDRFKKNKTLPYHSAQPTPVKPAEKSASASADKDKKETVASQARPPVGASLRPYEIISHPVVSEKSAHAEAQNTYTFVVARQATKQAVKEAVKAIYGVRPVAVRTINVEGKEKRFGRTIGRRGDWKKALVTLPKGQTIQVHEGV